jgi:hypothetical protein
MAKYFTSDIFQVKALVKRIKEAVIAKKEVEFIVRSDERKGGRSQKNYAHVIIGILAMSTGYTREFVKQEIFKRQYNFDIFAYERLNPVTGKLTIEMRSIEDDCINLSLAIERFRNGSADPDQYNVYLPEPHEKQELERYEYEMQFYKYF